MCQNKNKCKNFLTFKIKAGTFYLFQRAQIVVMQSCEIQMTSVAYLMFDLFDSKNNDNDSSNSNSNGKC